MYHYVSDVISLRANLLHTRHHTSANTEEGFLMASANEKKVITLKLIKEMFLHWDTLRRWACVARLLFRPSVYVCVC